VERFFYFARYEDSNPSDGTARAMSTSAACGGCSECELAQRSKKSSDKREAPADFFRHRKRGCKATSSPSFSAKKERTFVYQKFVLFLSKPQAWHIIAARSAVHIIKVGKPTLYLITRQRAFPCGLMRCNTAC